ncbi:hypothetical protein ACROYT_G015789 [Oculina patagonica]
MKLMHNMSLLMQRTLLVLFVFAVYTKGAISAPCSFKVEGPKGTISFPRLGSITDCSWLITAPLNHSIFLTFATFELYYKADIPGELDKETTRLQIWDGEDEYATLLGSFRGTKRPFSLQSSGRNLFLRLIVDPNAPLCNFEGCYVSMTTKEKPILKIPAAVVKALPDYWLWCSAEGTPPVYIGIMKNGNVLTNSTGYAMVRVNNEGTYRCVASNKAGMDSKDIQVTLSTNCDKQCVGYGQLAGGRAHNYFGCRLTPYPDNIFKCAPTISAEMTLRENKIREIPENSFHSMGSLRILDLRWNEIRTLNSDVFRDLKELRELLLGVNKIEGLPDGIFQTLSNLQILDISSNQIEMLPRGILANVITLQRLDASLNKINELYNETFRNLSSLVRLNLERNRIANLPAGVFDNLKSLSYLNLLGNKIEILPPGVFRNLKTLKTLELGSNKIKELPTGVFQETNLLRHLDLGVNSIKYLEADVFQKMTLLETLNLRINEIGNIPRDSFKNLKELRQLYLMTNKLVFLEDGLLQSNTKLGKLELSENQLTTIPANLMGNLSSLLTLTLGDNQLKEIPQQVGSMKNLQLLDLSRNKIERIPVRLLAKLNQLKLLTLQRNRISSISSQTFANLTDLEYLLLNKNTLSSIPDEAFLNLRKLKILMLSDNKIVSVGDKAFIIGNSSSRISMNEGEIGSLAFKDKNGSSRCSIHLGVGQSEDEYVQFDDIAESMKHALRSALQQSGFAGTSFHGPSVTFLPCPTGTFVNSSAKGYPGCQMCPPGGYYSDTLAYVSDQCKKCPNGTFVSLDNRPGKRASDCVACPQGTDTDSFAGFRGCKCLTGFYRTHLFESCQPCQQDGLQCVNDYATLKPGFWWQWYNDVFKGLYRNFTLNLRSSNPSFDSHVLDYPFNMPKPYECPRKESCLGGLNSGCEDGYEGPLCEVCSRGYYKRFQTCRKCPSRAWMAGQLTITAVLLVILFVVVVWTSIRKSKRSKQRPLVDIILARLKIIIGFYQVTFGLLEAFAFVQWPDSLAVISKYSEMLQLNVLQIAPLHCLFPQLKVDAFGSLFAILAMNGTAVFFALVAYWVRKFMILKNHQLDDESKLTQISKTKELVYRNLFFFLFVTYLSTCSKTANVLPLACREICYDDTGDFCFKYLKSDFTVECRSPRYKRLVVVAYCAIVYIVCLPLAAFVVLWRKHRNIKVTEDDSRRHRQNTNNELAAGIRFLCENYNANSWYWELVETVRKVILTSGLILVGGESRAYVGLACVVSGLYGIFFAYVSPVEDRFENKLMLISLAVTFVNLGIGAVSKIPKENVPASIDPYVDSVMFKMLVIGANTLVIGLLVVQYAVYLYQFIKEWRKNPTWSMSCCLAMLLPLNDLQGELRGLAGRNIMRMQLQSGRIGMPSVAGAVKDTGAVDFELEEGDDEATENQDQHNNSHSPRILRCPENASINDVTFSPLVVHFRRNKSDTPL